MTEKTILSTGSTASPRGSITLTRGTSLYVGAVLGTGVIALPALAARVAGPASLVAWAGLVVLSIPLAATFASLGSRHPDSGGVSTYVRLAFGRRAAAVVGWCFYFAVPVGAPAAAMFGGAYVSQALGGGRGTELATAVALTALVTALNLVGLRISGRFQVGLSVLLILLLVVAVATAAPHARLSHLRPFAPHGWLAVGSAAALLVWSFCGWEAVTPLAAEFRRPRRDLPRATAIAIAIVAVFYLAVAAATILVLGPAAGGTQAPLASLLATGVNGSTRLIAAGAALLLTLGTMNAYVAGAAKLGAALARDGVLPRVLAGGSQAGEVPRRSLTLVAGLAMASMVVAAALDADPQPLVLATSGAFALVYLLGMAAAVRLLPAGSLGRRVAVIATVVSLGLLATVGPYLAWPAAIALGALAYTHRRHTTPRPALTPVAAEAQGVEREGSDFAA